MGRVCVISETRSFVTWTTGSFREIRYQFPGPVVIYINTHAAFVVETTAERIITWRIYWVDEVLGVSTLVRVGGERGKTTWG